MLNGTLQVPALRRITGGVKSVAEDVKTVDNIRDVVADVQTIKDGVISPTCAFTFELVSLNDVDLISQHSTSADARDTFTVRSSIKTVRRFHSQNTSRRH